MLAQFISHGHYYLWQYNLFGLKLISDLLIAIACYAIPSTLIYCVRKSKYFTFSTPTHPHREGIIACKLTEQAWQDSESILRSFYNSAPMMMGIIELIEQKDFRHISANNRAAAFFSLTTKTIQGKRASELGISPEIRNKLVNACLQSQTTLKPTSFEFTGDFNQDKKHFSITVSKISLKTLEKHSRFSYIMSDISDRKQMDILLKENEERFRLAFEDAPIGMALVAIEGLFLKVNHSLCEIFGYSEPELLSLTSQDITHPEDLEIDLNFVSQLIEDKINHYQMEKRYLHKLGHEVWILLSVSLVRDLQKQPQYFVAHIQDISDRKSMEKTLQESEERWQLAIRGANDGIWDWNVRTKEVFFSKRWKEMLGYEEQEISNTLEEWEKRVHPDDLAWVIQVIQDHFAKKTPFYVSEHRVLCKDGSYKWILDRGQALWDEEGNVLRMAGSHTDITKRKVVETEITRSLQEQLEEKEVLLKEIHHRVKNNLQVICSLLNLQARYLKEEKLIKYFKEAQNKVRSMALVHEQLYQSKNLSKLSLLDYVEQLIGNLFRAYSITNNVNCKTKIDGFYLDLDAAIPCGLIINEIVSNALKYAFPSQDKGEIRIEAFPDKANNLVLVIADNGIGLKSDFNLEKSKSLGLKLVKSLTQQLQGDWKIQSDSNSGTRFEFTFTRIKK